ncbi:hypothetical protein STEG23_000774, partial [Scotinomys teguina]
PYHQFQALLLTMAQPSTGTETHSYIRNQGDWKKSRVYQCTTFLGMKNFQLSQVPGIRVTCCHAFPLTMDGQHHNLNQIQLSFQVASFRHLLRYATYLMINGSPSTNGLRRLQIAFL